MKKFLIFWMLLSAFLPAGRASTPLSLSYSVTNLGGTSYEYNFTLTLDNHDGTWTPGDSWGWLIFADSPTASPLANFFPDTTDLPVGPWTSFSATSGTHNGPTFAPTTNLWEPTAIGNSLAWSGTSTADLAQGQLLFSTRLATGGNAADFEVATRTVPEPSTYALLGLGLLSLIWAARKQNRRCDG